MGASYRWKGGVEFAGVGVAMTLWPLVQSPSKDGFKMVAPNGGRVSQKLVDSDDNEVSRSDTAKGYDLGGQLLKLDEAILGRMDRTGLAELRGLHPYDSVPWRLARTTWAVRPDKDSPGADGNLQLLWNGLLEADLVYVTEVTMTSGSRDKLVALYATEDDLFAAELPYHVELRADTPAFEFERDEAKAAVFAQFIDVAEIEVEDFDHAAIESQWHRRRDDAIQAALSDEPLPEAETPKATPSSPDLMAALEASIAKASGKGSAKKAPAKKPAAKKVTK